MKLLLITLLSTLLLLTLPTCTKAPYNFLTGEPKLSLRGPRLTMVGKPCPITYTLMGRLPAPDQPVGIMIKVFGDERASTVTPIHQRVNKVILTFTDLDYYESMGKLRGNEFGDTWIDRSIMDPEQHRALTDMEDDSGIIYIDIELYLVEPHPTHPDRWQRIKLWTKARWKVKIECPHCLM